MLPFVGVPPQKMLGFVRLFSPFSGTAPPPLAQSFPPLQYRFEAFFLCSSFVRCAERAAFQTRSFKGWNFKCDPCRRVQFQICPRRKTRLGENPQANRDNPSRFRAPNLGKAATLKKPIFSCFVLGSIVRQPPNPKDFSHRHSRSFSVMG